MVKNTILIPTGCFTYSDLQFPQSPFQAFGEHFKGNNDNWYHCHFHAPLLFQLSGKIQVFFYFLFSFIFTLWCTETTKSTN